MTPGRAALLALILFPAPLAAQWTVDAAAGRAVHDPVSARIGSTVASLGLSFRDEAARWLYLSAGTPLQGAGPAWGAGGAGAWLGVERGGASLGLSAGAHAFGYSATDSVRAGGGATLELIPTLSWEGGRLQAELASGLVATADALGDSTTTRALSESYATVGYQVAEGARVAAEGRYVHADGAGHPYAGARASVARSRADAWAYAGRWLSDEMVSPRSAYGAGAGYALDRRTRVELSLRQETADPVYFASTPRRTWSVVLSRRFGALPAPRAAPGLAPVFEGGAAVFRLPRREGETAAPALVGDFNGWRPAAMTAEGELWTARVVLRPGVHHYGYRNGAGEFFLPPGVPAVDDGMGGVSAVLLVP